MISPRSRRGLNVIVPGGAAGGAGAGTVQDERLKCPECDHFEMHVYKQDSTLYFCSHCMITRPIRDIKRDVVVVPPPRGGGKTFIQQAPRRRQQQKKKPRGVMEKMLRDQGFSVVDYEEVIS